MSASKSKVRRIILIVVLFFAIFAPWVAGQAWYLWHHDGIVFRNKLIPSTPGWVLLTDLKTLPPNIWYAHLPTFSWQIKDKSLIYYMNFGGETTPHTSAKEIVDSLAPEERALKTGWMIEGPFSVPSLEGDSSCVRATSPDGTREEMRCSLFHAQWTAAFLGPHEYEKDFLNVISGIHDAAGDQ